MRVKVPKDIEAALLLGCRRRCAICFGISRDSGVKRGQIAHLDRDSSNSGLENLAFLCLDHHDQYDSIPSQSKRFTKTEVKVFKAELEEALAAALAAPLTLNESVQVAPEIESDEWAGIYRAELAESKAEIEVTSVGSGHYSVRGIAFFGISRELGPNIGELEGEGNVEGDCLVVTMGDYALRLRPAPNGAIGDEVNLRGHFGMGVSFGMAYRKLPRGGDVLPQPERRVFESEFWPEEGVPQFVSRAERLLLRARPSSDAPLVAEWLIKTNEAVPFDGFRYRTVRPGSMVARRDGELVGRNLGRTDYVSHANYFRDGGENVTVRFRTGDSIEYLQYRAEGTAFLRWQGLALDTDLPSNSDFELTSHPVAESWVRVEDPSSGSSGWVLVDEQLEEVRRQF